MGPDRRFLPSETRVSLLRFHRPSIEEAEEAGMQTTMPGIAIDWVVSRSSYRQGGWLNVQSGHRNVHGMCRAVLRGEGNTEKVGMVTCCPEPQRRRITVNVQDRATFRAGCQNGKGRWCEPMSTLAVLGRRSGPGLQETVIIRGKGAAPGVRPRDGWQGATGTHCEGA